MTGRRDTMMLLRSVTLTAACLLIAAGFAPLAAGQPAPPPPVPPAEPVADPLSAPPSGAVLSGAPGILDTPDGWHVEVQGVGESQVPVAPLTTAVSSREYLVSGTFIGNVTGEGATELTGGTLEAGYQIGCGILADEIGIEAGGGFDVNVPFDVLDADIELGGGIDLLPGEVNIVEVAAKRFEGTETRVTVTGLRVNFDRCAGQSFIRSYATLAVSTEDTEDVVTYLGVTKVV